VGFSVRGVSWPNRLGTGPTAWEEVRSLREQHWASRPSPPLTVSCRGPPVEPRSQTPGIARQSRRDPHPDRRAARGKGPGGAREPPARLPAPAAAPAGEGARLLPGTDYPLCRMIPLFSHRTSSRPGGLSSGRQSGQGCTTRKRLSTAKWDNLINRYKIILLIR
jgi:hypothetical protein